MAIKWIAVNAVPSVPDIKDGILAWGIPGDQFGTKDRQLVYAYEFDGNYYADRKSITSADVPIATKAMTGQRVDGTPERKRLLTWLKKAISSGALDTKYSIQQPVPKPRRAFEGIAPAEAKITHPDPAVSSALGGPYTIDQFNESWTKKSAHSFEQIVSILNDALGTTFRLWGGWAPKGLVVLTLTHQNIMGQATPVTYLGQRKVWMNQRLFTDYNADSIRRTFLHELAHHKRYDEGYGDKDRAVDHTAGHDERFCELLAMVDEVVRAEPLKNCRYFNDDIDPETMLSRTKGATAKDIVVVFEQVASKDKRGRFGKWKYTLKVKPRGSKKFSPIVFPADADGLQSILTSYGGDPEAIAGLSTVNGEPLPIVKTFRDVVFEMAATDERLRSLRGREGKGAILKLADTFVTGGDFDVQAYGFRRGVATTESSLRKLFSERGDLYLIEVVLDERLKEPGSRQGDATIDLPLMRLTTADGLVTPWLGIKPTTVGALASIYGSKLRSIQATTLEWRGSAAPDVIALGVASDTFNRVMRWIADEKKRNPYILTWIDPVEVKMAQELLGAAPSGGIFRWFSRR